MQITTTLPQDDEIVAEVNHAAESCWSINWMIKWKMDATSILPMGTVSELQANAGKAADLPKSGLVRLLAGCEAASIDPIVDSGVNPAVHLINGRSEIFRVQIQIRVLSNVVELTA